MGLMLVDSDKERERERVRPLCVCGEDSVPRQSYRRCIGAHLLCCFFRITDLVTY